jgi:hypothetical protein
MIKAIPRHSFYFSIDFNSVFLRLCHVDFEVAKVVLGNISGRFVWYDLICKLVLGVDRAAKLKSVLAT